LYRLPLPSFTAERNALAKTLASDAAKRVKQLAKPTTPAWAVNQVYWSARPIYDRLLKRGTELRDAQVAALRGRDKNVRPASDAHRKALAEAVAEAMRLAADQGVRSESEELTRLFEAVSLVPEHPERPGRLTQVHRLTGFEGLQGIAPLGLRGRSTPAVESAEAAPTRHRTKPPTPAESRAAERKARVEAARQVREARREEARRASEQRRQKAVITSAERAAERARNQEAKARAELERAQRTLREAEAAVRAAREKVV
jgi:hypothetical protein